MSNSAEALPDDIEALKRLVLARESDLMQARARESSADALIAHLRLTIEKLRREAYGQRSERGARLLDQMELELEELEAAASDDELAAERAAAAAGTMVRPFTRKKPSRKPFPEHLPRERIIVPGPTACSCCGSSRLAKLGEDVTETLEVVPRQWKVLQYVREKFTCRACERISQAPAPFHVLPRGFAGPNLLAMVLFEKYGQHQPLNRQSERYGREGVDLSLSTLADQVGGCAALLRPLYELIRAHVLAASRVHGDDTTVPVLAKGKITTGRAWVYVRDDRPFGGLDPPAALFHYSRDRTGEHPERHLKGYAGILQADAYAGFNRLYAPDRRPCARFACRGAQGNPPPDSPVRFGLLGLGYSDWPVKRGQFRDQLVHESMHDALDKAMASLRHLESTANFAFLEDVWAENTPAPLVPETESVG